MEVKKQLNDTLKKLEITKPGTTQVVINCNPDTGMVCDWLVSTRHK